jgi:hypothetical protein
MPPFLMSIVSFSDLWLFAGSNGPFTAGRVDPDGAIFPYLTVDKIVRTPDSEGALTIFLAHRGGRTSLWEPWRESGRAYRIRRNLHKHIHCGIVVFEEINDDLGLEFSWSLSASDAYGVVRQCRLTNIGADPAEIRYLDGWRRLMVPGVSNDTYSRHSYLAEAYMRHERVPSLPLGLFTLNAGITDTSDPYETLRATTAWSIGHPNPRFLLCERQCEAFRSGAVPNDEPEIRGETGAFLAVDSVQLAPGESHEWLNVVDTRMDHAAIVRLKRELRSPGHLRQDLEASLRDSLSGLRRLVAGADGLEETADAAAGAHHFSNVTFNCMRGGTFADSDRFPRTDVAAFLSARNTSVARRHADWPASLPERLTLRQLREAAGATGDPELVRVLREYLPLTFSRRHGDPSRPWNGFSIHIKDPVGEPVYGYQGNWRDIFQNWESLAMSYPEALEAMIAVFLNASTADGYNPLRISRDGIDWDVHHRGDPWSFVGYFGDHQVIYLLRLLEMSHRFYPGRLAGALGDCDFAYAHVPYEIAGFDAMIADPRHTITYNHDLDDRLRLRKASEGADGFLLKDAGGRIVRVTLAEKLLAPLLAKLSNLVPDGGTWLNTQRPEWNDANNALAGWGLSVVTVQYVRRYLRFLDTLLNEADGAVVSVTAPVARFVSEMTAILSGWRERVDAGLDGAGRYAMMEALGRAGENYRNTLYSEGLEGRCEVGTGDLRALIAAAVPIVDHTIRSNRREDGLYHSYNVLSVPEPGNAEIKHLYPMLEGQVAALSSGLTTPEEALGILRALRQSDMYRADQHSYTLYPDHDVQPFLNRNNLPEGAGERVPLLARLVAAGDVSLVVRDEQGVLHFQGDLHNAVDLTARLDTLEAAGRWADRVRQDRNAVMDLWEDVFVHSEFTGRSGTFFAFEGLGSVYWHMVAKLLLATQECWRAAVDEGAAPGVVAGLAARYEDIRNGMCFRKTPQEYGAFPTDAYSHTPRHKGAQQPGMTGQVKEEILARWGELGVEISGGRVRFAPRLLRRSEFHAGATEFSWVDVGGGERSWNLPAGSLAFTFCQVPVCYEIGAGASVSVHRRGGRIDTVDGNALNAADSDSIFGRRGEIDRLRITVPEKEIQQGP